jgi:PAS domain S-box-containing protein
LSPSIRSILGYEPEELIGTKTYDLLHPDDEETQTLLKSLVSGAVRNIHIEMKARHKDGSWRWLDMTSTDMNDDPAIGAIVSNFRDITERKKYNEALTNSEKRFRALIEHNHDGIALVDRDLKLIYLSPSVEQLSGFRQEELTGMMALDLIHPDDIESNLEVIASLARGESLRISSLLRIRHRDGIMAMDRGHYIDQLSDPAVQTIVANFRDVTERKKAEDELEQLNASLERKVEERTRELLESNKAMESFSYTAAHDLQGPLRVLSGYAALLRREYSHRMDEDGLMLTRHHHH